MSKLNVKEFKKRFLRGMVEPELFYLPFKDECEPMIIKVLVTDVENKMTIFFNGSNVSFNYRYFKYLKMEEEYKDTHTIKIEPFSGGISLPIFCNYTTDDISSVLVTDDIDFFRNSSDCLFKSHDDSISTIIYSKLFSDKSPYCIIDWGDGIVENCNDIIRHYNNRDIMGGYKYHTYSEQGEYYIKIKGRVPHISFQFTFATPTSNIVLQEVVKWGNLHLYSIDNLFDHENNSNKFKMPEKIPAYSFANVVSAQRAFYGCSLDESEFSQEIIYDFVNTFPNLVNAYYMFGDTDISYIPEHFCYEHKNIINAEGMFYDTKVAYIGNSAFAHCSQLSSVANLVYNSSKQPLPLLTKIGDGIFENDTNLLYINFAFNYINYNNGYSAKSLYTYENLGLKTVGDNVYKNCKRLRWAFEPFYQQSGLIFVGQSLFEGCEDLISVELCFYKCWSLEKIGDNIFKDCTKVRDFEDLCYENYLVNFPDKMLYDLKYYDYLNGSSNYQDFNGYWLSISEQDSQLVTDGDNGLITFFKFKGYNHDNFPTRKHSKNLFSEEYLTDCINHSNAIFSDVSNGIFNSIITIDNRKAEGSVDRYIISNFTGEAYPIWELSNFELLFNDLNSGDYVFGARNIKVQSVHPETQIVSYGTSINYYDNYTDIATADPIIHYANSYETEYGFLNMYYTPVDSENYTVLEFNDPIIEV